MPICDVCWTEFPVLSGPKCARCGDSLDSPAAESGAGLCRPCRLAPPPFVRAVAFGLYQDRMRAAIHALKYDRLQPAAHGLGRMLALAIAQLVPEAPGEMLVVPVPLHRSKYAERGFNQARALARHALDFLAVSHPEWRLTLAASTLMRHRATESQAGLSPRERRINVRGAFLVSDPATVKMKHILVIDDIYTTGATARAAARALVQAGAASVWIATLARARRAFATRRGFDDNVEDHENNTGLPGDAPDARHGEQPPSMYSSHNQPSF